MALASGNDLIAHCSSCYVLVHFSDMENMCNWVFVQLGVHLALWTFGTFYTFELYPDTNAKINKNIYNYNCMQHLDNYLLQFI